LQVLNLSSNQIGVKGCEALAPVLPQLTALEKLDLSENQIGAKGKTMMREAWKNAGNEGGLSI
jgi:hypothetical protein